MLRFTQDKPSSFSFDVRSMLVMASLAWCGYLPTLCAQAPPNVQAPLNLFQSPVDEAAVGSGPTFIDPDLALPNPNPVTPVAPASPPALDTPFPLGPAQPVSTPAPIELPAPMETFPPAVNSPLTSPVNPPALPIAVQPELPDSGMPATPALDMLNAATPPPAVDVDPALNSETNPENSIANPAIETRPPERVAQVPTTPVVNDSLSRLVGLRNISAGVFRERIGRLYPNKLQAQRIAGTQFETLRLPAIGGRALELKINYERNSVVLTGDQTTVGSWERMIQFLDRPAVGRGEQSELVALAQTKQASVQRVADIVKNLAAAPKQLPRPPANIVQWDRNKTRTLAQGPETPAPAGEAAAVDSPGLTGPVLIQYVEGLDAIILRGNKPDVDRVRKIIQEIEDLSAITEPSIVVVDLEHVDSESMAELVRPLQEEILSSRQGRVSITPLIKPNSILMIGRLQGVNVVQELIKKLDRPVDPEKEFHVFRLENLSALEAEEAIERFYNGEGAAAGADGAAGRPGLGAKVNVVADYRTNSLIVQANPRDAEELRQLLKKIDTTQAAAKDEVRVFQLKNTLAEDIGPLLQQVLTGEDTGAGGGQGNQGNQGNQGGDDAQARAATLSLRTLDRRGQQLYESGILTDVEVVPNTQGNTLVVRGPKDGMPLIAELIRQLDELPSEDAEIKVFTIVNGDATRLGDLLANLFGTANAGNQQQQGGNNGNNGTTGAINPLIPLRFSVDARTNIIVATGSIPDLRVVEAILLRLDEKDAKQRQTETFRLRYAPANDVATAINSFLDGRRNLQTLAPDTVTQFGVLNREVIVVPEPVSNSLVVSATPEYFDEIHRIVRELDAQPPMVAIQMLIAEVDLSQFYELGVEIGIQDPLLFDRSVVGGDFDPGFNFNNGNLLGNAANAASLATAGTIGAQGLGSFGLGRVNSELGFGGLVLSASNDALSILIRALQEDQRLQVLSRPQITTLDNQPAFVQVGQRVPFVTGTNVNGFGGTSSQVSLLDVGIILGVTPRVTPDGLIVMELDATKSQLGAVADGIPIAVGAGGEIIQQPILQSTTAQTTVSARNGQTVVIGGLITETDSEIHRGVPFLSDIPLIGDLFRYDQDSKERRELILIMTPYLIRDDDDLNCFNRMETSRMSWCLNDAYRVHGTGNACPNKWPTAYGNETQPLTIYPDRNPAAGPARATPYSPLSTRVNNQAANGLGAPGGVGAVGTGGAGLAGVPPNAQILSDRPMFGGGTAPNGAAPGLPSVPNGAPQLFSP